MTSRKAGRKPGQFRPDDPRINRTKPGPGRPKLEQRAFLRDWFESDEGRQHTLAWMMESDRVLIAMHAQAYGLPPQTVDVGGDVKLRIEIA